MDSTKVTKDLSRQVLSLAEGLFAHTVDFSLWLVAYTNSLSVPQRTGGQLWRAQLNADEFIGQVNYEVIKQALKTAKRHCFITKTRKRHAWPEMTAEGKRRLAAVIPDYDEQRVWDGTMHLATYDIPETRSKDRGLLRSCLKRIGCGRLQDSVWITPYNPIDTLRSFIEDHDLRGTIIVSAIGRDGSIGEEDISTLVAKVYHLEALNERYEEYLSEAKHALSDQWLLIKYFSILQDDPQLPFPLLPSWWKGKEAYERVRSQLRKVSNYFRPEGKKHH